MWCILNPGTMRLTGETAFDIYSCMELTLERQLAASGDFGWESCL